jgi:HEAT repeat protein
MRTKLAIGALSVLTVLGPALARVSAEAVEDTERESREAERQSRQEEERQREEERASREEEEYERGTEALDESNWDDAVRAFSNVVRMSLKRADAALYWKAYAQARIGRRPDALASLGELRKSFPSSRWLNEAQALETEIRQDSGQAPTPEKAGDDDLKLMALNGLLNSDAERAVPMIEKLLQGNASLRVKDRALFVLSQDDSPAARALIARLARGQNPHLQSKALKYLGMSGDEESKKVLAEVYSASTDVEVKRTILKSFMIAGDEARVLAAAKTEKAPELRREAIRQLGVMSAHAGIWELYRTEASVDLKKDMIQALFVGDASDKLLELARNEPNLELRRAAIRNLGLMSETGPALLSIYAKETSRELKEDVIQALFVQDNAKALVGLARSEKDPELRKEMVEKLSHMDAKESMDYLLEILNK